MLDFYSTNSLSWEQLEFTDGELRNLHYGMIHVGLPTLLNLKESKLPTIKEGNEPKSYTLCVNGDVAFADASEDTNDVAKAIELVETDGQKVVFGLHTIHGRDNKGLTEAGFKGYLFSSKVFHDQIKRIAQGTKVFSISSKNFSECFVGLPSKAEQSKIARLLSLLDRKITVQSKLIEDLKKVKISLMEKLFCLPKERTPKLRLYKVVDDWQRIKLSDVVERVTIRNRANSCTRVLTIAAQHGLIDQQDFFKKQIASSNLSTYYLLHRGDFAYNKSYSSEYPWGAVKRLDDYDDGVLSSLYICFRPNKKVDSDYLRHYFESTKWYRGISEISGEGARNHGLLNMSVEDFFDTEHRIPSIDEQRKIAHLFNILFKKLHAEEMILSQYQNQKNYLLNNMFI